MDPISTAPLNLKVIYNDKFTLAQFSAIESPVLLDHLNSFNIAPEEMQLPWKHDGTDCPYQIPTNSKSQEESGVYKELFAKLAEGNCGDESCDLIKQFQKLSEPEQLRHFLDSQNITKERLRSRWQFILDTLIILRKHFPLCEVYPFGSSVTGLGDPSSDVDMFVDVNGDGGKLIGQDPNVKQAIVRLRDDVMRIVQQSHCPHKMTAVFTENAKALGTRVPYLKFIHAPSNIECDLTFGNRLSLQNSRLIQFYMKFDDRVRPFFTTLLFWKNLGANRNIKFRKYPLILLALVYLIKKRIVPCVSLLQRLALEQRVENGVDENADEMEGWDSSFCEDVHLVKEHFERDETNQSITGILLGFLEMVAKTDFSTVVVCPLLGELIPKRLILTEYADEGEGGDIMKSWTSWAANQRNLSKKLKIDTPICIQDSFVLNDNVGILVDQDILNRFRDCCEDTVKRVVKQGLNANGNPHLLSFLWSN